MVYKFFQNKNTEKITIILDDYSNRKSYHVLSEFFEIKSIDRIAVMIPKKNKDISNELIEKYSLDFN